MNALIERLEAMGRTGGAAALGLSGALVAVAGTLAWLSVGAEGWWLYGYRFPAAILAAFAMAITFVGVRLLTQRHYPSAAEVFPPLSPDRFAVAVRERDEPVCACARCRVVLSAAFSTGACPVCTSSVDYYEVDSDDDAEMVILAAS